MEIFGLNISEEELSNSLTRIYNQRVKIEKVGIDCSSKVPMRRLACINFVVDTYSGTKVTSCLLKESSCHELTAISFANIILPYSSPRVIWYTEAPVGMWMLLENITTNIDIGGGYRVNEAMLDGLYDIHSSMLGTATVLLHTFHSFSLLQKSQLKNTALKVLKEIETLKDDPHVSFLFGEWSDVALSVENTLKSVEKVDFPVAFCHGNYYPNTIRGIFDSSGRVRAVPYDWMYSYVGYPQVDLALLCDRIDVISLFQGLQPPSDILLERYKSMLLAEFDNVDLETFDKIYKFCYVSRALPLIKWWIQPLIKSPSDNPKRATIEIKVKLNRILNRVLEVDDDWS